MFKHFINNKKKMLTIYFLFTLVPAITISHILSLKKTQEYELEYMSQAQALANFHGYDIERFIGETISRLDMLATLININPNDLNNVEEILTRTQEKDIRFSGFYWATPDGDLIIGTNNLNGPVNVSDREYFQQAVRNGQYSISPAHIGRVTGRFVNTIAAPVFNNEEISGVLLGSIRIDKIEKSVLGKINDELIHVTDDLGQTIIQSDALLSNQNYYSHTIELDIVPWKITAYIMPEENFVYLSAFLKHLGISLIITNIFYLFLRYSLLKRRIKLEKKENEMQKIELVENLAASTAHEIRNPLTGIKGLVQLLSEKHKDEKDQLYFKIIQEEVNRINSIVSELLLLGKPTAHTLKTYDANEIIKEIEPIIRSESNYKSVDLYIDYTNYDLPILCVKDHLKQVMLNLIKNSLEAVDTSGKVVVRLEKNETYCLIQVVDNGCGMTTEVLDQVFDPFFTMKDNGTGLGLVVCRRIIRSYGGEIHINSHPNEGTKVELQIPLVKND
ncbi:ATP-binding protein [Halalkalibacter krulwichiae]|uniref:histidine kinase n=1 Tax=Halalkalibacter krulwichiae TaxID=199441 RepID=A0A1X9MAV6_9BACI|nr:ATP-binding protein [Halalkalibacter krulwichiae]ARK30547.1 Sporulation kinase D [Halalkalibacter krulwichiae]